MHQILLITCILFILFYYVFGQTIPNTEKLSANECVKSFAFYLPIAVLIAVINIVAFVLFLLCNFNVTPWLIYFYNSYIILDLMIVAILGLFLLAFLSPIKESLRSICYGLAGTLITIGVLLLGYHMLSNFTVFASTLYLIIIHTRFILGGSLILGLIVYLALRNTKISSRLWFAEFSLLIMASLPTVGLVCTLPLLFIFVNYLYPLVGDVPVALNVIDIATLSESGRHVLNVCIGSALSLFLCSLFGLSFNLITVPLTCIGAIIGLIVSVHCDGNLVVLIPVVNSNLLTDIYLNLTNSINLTNHITRSPRVHFGVINIIPWIGEDETKLNKYYIPTPREQAVSSLKSTTLSHWNSFNRNVGSYSDILNQSKYVISDANQNGSVARYLSLEDSSIRYPNVYYSAKWLTQRGSQSNYCILAPSAAIINDDSSFSSVMYVDGLVSKTGPYNKESKSNLPKYTIVNGIRLGPVGTKVHRFFETVPASKLCLELKLNSYNRNLAYFNELWHNIVYDHMSVFKTIDHKEYTEYMTHFIKTVIATKEDIKAAVSLIDKFRTPESTLQHFLVSCALRHLIFDIKENNPSLRMGWLTYYADILAKLKSRNVVSVLCLQAKSNFIVPEEKKGDMQILSSHLATVIKTNSKRQ